MINREIHMIVPERMAKEINRVSTEMGFMDAETLVFNAISKYLNDYYEFKLEERES